VLTKSASKDFQPFALLRLCAFALKVFCMVPAGYFGVNLPLAKRARVLSNLACSISRRLTAPRLFPASASTAA
jgi:hypothetical protein